MCGIAGVYLKDPTAVKSQEGLESFVNTLFLGIEPRGQRATGFVAVNTDGAVVMDKAPCTASEFIQTREKLPQNTKMVLLHTRLDTKGSPKDHRNNHPVIHKTCFTVHNGSVMNDDALFEDEELQRNAEVDSEIIPALLYQTDFDVGAMKKAFEKMHGSIACASIDPVRHPNKLILARTKNSPLVLIDTERFLVWASTEKAIRDAWGSHIGTPPNSKRFKNVWQHKMLVVTDDNIEEHELPFQTYTSGGYGWTFLPHSTYSSSTKDSHTSVRSYVDNSAIKERVLRDAKHGGGTAILFSEKGMLSKRRASGPWKFCPVCDRNVHEESIKPSIKGRICFDCYDVWMEMAASNRAATSSLQYTQRDTPKLAKADFDTLNTALDTNLRYRLNEWAKDEAFIQDGVLHELSRFTGLDKETLEYLLFRMTREEIESIPGYSDWQGELLDLYDFEYEQLWSMTYPGRQERGIAILREAATEAVNECELKALPKGEDAPFPVRFPINVESDDCTVCGALSTWHIVRGTETVNYCRRHFDECHEEECDCEAVTTTDAGTRLCHFHSRGVKAVADPVLRKEGFHVGAMNE